MFFFLYLFKMCCVWVGLTPRGVQKSNMMNVCLHCSRPCVEEAVFCDECQTRRDINPFFPTADAAASLDDLTQASTLDLSPQLEYVDQTVSRLNEAARWIEEEEPGGKHLRRSVRLAPLRDISSEIQRASTPHPSI